MNTRHWHLKTNQELRLLIGRNDNVSVTLLPDQDRSEQPQGRQQFLTRPPLSAEIFGASLCPGLQRNLARGEQTAVYTWTGCTLEVKGLESTDLCYQDQNPPMNEYLNTAAVLHRRRLDALMTSKGGPRVLIAGSSSSGKTSLALLLCNYAVRQGWTPAYVELDPRGGNDKLQLQFLPGTIGATLIDSVETEEVNRPLMYFFGSLHINDDYPLFKKLCSRLSAALNVRMGDDALLDMAGEDEHHPHSKPVEMRAPERPPLVPDLVMRQEDGRGEPTVRDLPPREKLTYSGVILNAPPQASRDHIRDIVRLFQVDVVLVLDDPSLRQALAQHYDSSHQHDVGGHLAALLPKPDHGGEQSPSATRKVDVVALPKAAGVVQVTEERMKDLRQRVVGRYYHGDPEYPLHPQVITLSSTACHFYKLDASAFSSSLLPAGQQQAMLQEFRPSAYTGRPPDLALSFLGVTYARPGKTEDLLFANLAALVFVQAVEAESTAEEAAAADENVAMGDDAKAAGGGGGGAPTSWKLQLLCPAGGELPSKMFVVGQPQKLRMPTGVHPLHQL
ncbi:unnamed protein product [Vitrella brassicaformis CCMP3155]|uniref:Uncharacterized protein n=3 Tax=Vitrella brassicaformis TaxID=1169539 RepID=A0A0G4G2J2_VITBC|nr:unnamed protein product [Vitrella brassicaformis CCMP3155]|eukprot:CEM22499.1 unnamed protein product [Vitrella brassicaformis CCMP3155]